MKAWRFYGFGDMRLDDVPEPVCRPGHVIAEPLCVQPSVTEAQLAFGIPTLAYEAIKRRLETEAPVQLFGHEFCARVVEVGEGVTRVRPGDRVAARAKLPCGSCPFCAGGKVDLPSPLQTGMAYLSTANPYATWALEGMTGKQFSTGRDLKDLYSKGLAGGYGVLPEEYAQPLTQAVAHSPLARFASTADQFAQVLQGRKSLPVALSNFLTGFKLTDVDMAKQRAVAARKELEGQFTADPRLAEFKNYYPKADAAVDPELAKKLQLFTRMKADAKAYHKARQPEPKWGSP